MAVRPRDLPASISPLCSLLLPTLRLPQLREKYKNIRENKNNTKESDDKNSAFKSKIWAWKFIFRRNSSYRFGSLGYDKIARVCAREKNPIQTNVLTQAWCEGNRNSQRAHVPNGSFLNSFLFAHFYLFFLFRYPLPWQENLTSDPAPSCDYSKEMTES